MKIPKAIHPLARFYGINRGINRAIDKAFQRYRLQRIWINKRKGICAYRAVQKESSAEIQERILESCGKLLSYNNNLLDRLNDLNNFKNNA